MQVTNPKNQYLTCILNDPNVPAGYVLTNTTDGSAQICDGVTDGDLKTYDAGVNSGGYPSYTADQSQLNAQPLWPNGIFGVTSGAKTTAQ